MSPDLNKFTEIISAMEIPISFGGMMRIDYEEKRIHFYPCSSEGEMFGMVDDSAVLSGAMERDVLALELAAGLLRQWKQESNAEEEAFRKAQTLENQPSFTPTGTNEDEPAIFGTPAEVAQAQKIMGPMVRMNGKPANDSLQEFVLR